MPDGSFIVAIITIRIAIVVVSKMTKEPEKEITKVFDEVKAVK